MYSQHTEGLIIKMPSMVYKRYVMLNIKDFREKNATILCMLIRYTDEFIVISPSNLTIYIYIYKLGY